MMKSQQGVLLIEILISIALMGIMLPALFGGMIISRQGKVQIQQRLQATMLLNEAQEAVRTVRDYDWPTFAVNGTYHPVASSGNWTLTSGSETINGFTRQVVISDVERTNNGTGAIVDTGGTLDPSTKKVVISVSWGSPLPSTVSTSLYITRHDNITYTDSTEADFDAGTHTGTATGSNGDGAVILGSGGSGDWCEPNLTLASEDLPKNGVANAISAIEGKVLAGTGENASGPALANVTIANTNPPDPSVAGTIDGYKTNGVFVENGYAYLTTDTNNEHVAIFQMNANGSFTWIGKFDAATATDANSIYVSNDIGFVTIGNSLRTFNLSSKSGTRAQLGSIALPGVGTKVVVNGSYAYISISGNAKRMQIVQFSNGGATLTNAGYYTNSSVGNGMDIAVNSTGTRAFVALAASGGPEMIIVNTSGVAGSNPSLPAVGSGYEANGMTPKGVGIATGNRAILVGTGGIEYQVIDITDESSLQVCGTGLNIDSGVNGVATVIESDDDAYSYIITGDASSELKIIEGGPGGGYANEGVFESKTYQNPALPFPARQTVYNKIFFNYSEPPQTSINFRVAVSNPGTGSCDDAVYKFLGPGGTEDDADVYDTDNLIPLLTDNPYQNPGLCFRYRAYMSTDDSSVSPILYDVIVNHSP